jgi:hypothetical protein
MRRRFRLAVAALLVAPAACAPFSRAGFQRPAVSLSAVDIKGLGFQGGSLDLHLAVHNPNPYALHTTRIAVGISLEGTHFGDAALAHAVTLAARDTTRVVVPIGFTWSGVGAGARGLLGRGAVRYQLEGRLDLDTPIGARGVDVAVGGDVTLRDLVGR